MSARTSIHNQEDIISDSITNQNNIENIKESLNNSSIYPSKNSSKTNINLLTKQNNKGNKEINLMKLSEIKNPLNKWLKKENISNYLDFSNSALWNKESNKKKRKKIIIEEICGNLFKNKRIEINEEGLIKGSMRNKKDGVTFFGSNDKSINDYALNMSENIFKYLPTVFKIYYNKKDEQYYIGTDNPGIVSEAMLFAKIEKDLIYKSKLLISLGSTYFFVEVKNDKLIINFTGETGFSQNYIYTKEKKKITIGRAKQCDIILHDVSYSRIHTTIVYNENINTWVLYDGEIYKKSTNGTWVFLNWFMNIYDDIKIRIGASIIKINVQNED